jgi:thiamine-phosphate pyrophosphorylase
MPSASVDFRLYLIADRRRLQGRPLVSALQAAAQAGVRVLQLREKELTPRELYALAQEVQGVLTPLGARLLLNDRVDVACATGVAGVHLTTTSLSPTAARRCLAAEALVGVSTHTLAEARFAEASGADFLTFGPVYATPSKAAYGAPRGLEALGAICAAVALPVFALGGVTPARVPECMAAGAHGVAAIGALLDVPDIAAAVAAFAAALGSL